MSSICNLEKNNDDNLKPLRDFLSDFIKLMLERIRIYEEKFREKLFL